MDSIMRNDMSIIFSQYFYNESCVAGYYWLLLLGQKSNLVLGSNLNQ